MPGEEKNFPIAVVRCEIIAENCAGSGCLNAFFDRRAHYQAYPPQVKIGGFFTCGGCPGRRVPRLLKKLKKYNVEAVHLSSCMVPKDDDVKCPFYASIVSGIEKLGLKVVAGTHY